MDKSSYRHSTLLYSRYVIWYQTVVLTGVFLCCWPALVTFASFCLAVFCFVLLYSFTISCAYGCCSWYVLEAGLINLKATTVSIFHSTIITPPIRWRCTYDDDRPDMIWAALGTLMQISLRSGYDLIGDICPDHINICADHCRSLLVLVHRYHGSCIRCPAFGSYSTTAGHSRATDCPGICYSDGGASSAEQIAQSAKQIGQIISKTDQKDRIVSRTVWSVLSRIEWNGLMDGWIDGIDFLIDAPQILRGLLKLAFNETLLVASPAHSHFSSGSNLNLVLYGSERAGVPRRLIGGRSALVGDGSWAGLDHSVSQSWAERTYSGYDRDDILHPLKTRCVPDS